MSLLLAFHPLSRARVDVHITISDARHPSAPTLIVRPLPCRQRARDGADGVLAQVQQRAVGADDGPAVLHRLVVPQGRGVLSPARVVRAPDVVARAAVRAHGLRLVRRVADGVPARHQGRGARRARGHEPEPECKCKLEHKRKFR